MKRFSEEDDIDFSLTRTKKLLRESPLRIQQGRAQIEIDGSWLMLGRTDLFGEADTYDMDDETDEITVIRRRYARSCIFGSRIKDGELLIVDSATDG